MIMPNLFAESMAKTIEAIKPKLNEIVSEFSAKESARIKKLETQTPKRVSKPQHSGGTVRLRSLLGGF
jgi:hypothetical protein